MAEVVNIGYYGGVVIKHHYDSNKTYLLILEKGNNPKWKEIEDYSSEGKSETERTE